MDLLQRLAHAADRGGFALERLDDRLIQAFEESRRQGLVEMSRQPFQDVRGLQPEAARKSRCQIPPGIGLAQHVHQDAIADDLAVDDHPVAVADQQIERPRGSDRFHKINSRWDCGAEELLARRCRSEADCAAGTGKMDVPSPEGKLPVGGRRAGNRQRLGVTGKRHHI